MLKNLTVLEITKNDRTYQLQLDPNSPLGEVHDVLMEMRGFVVSRMNEVAKQAEEARVAETASKNPQTDLQVVEQ